MSENKQALIPKLVLEPIVRAALLEDLGRAGDVTSAAVVPEHTQARVRMVARQPGVLAGLDAARLTFRLVDSGLRIAVAKQDGDALYAGDVIAHIQGNARALMTGERVALNFLGHLSGIATLTSQFAVAIAHTKARICCTRKTLPGLRILQKYAVRVGGGVNHRFGLDDGILIKDNHISASGGMGQAIARARASAGHMLKIEVEAETLAELDEALAAGVDAVLLDNMDAPTLKTAMARIAGRAIAEASGGVTLENVVGIAEAGVDLISIGALTHSAPNLDIALDFDALV